MTLKFIAALVLLPTLAAAGPIDEFYRGPAGDVFMYSGESWPSCQMQIRGDMSDDVTGLTITEDGMSVPELRLEAGDGLVPGAAYDFLVVVDGRGVQFSGYYDQSEYDVVATWPGSWAGYGDFNELIASGNTMVLAVADRQGAVNLSGSRDMVDGMAECGLRQGEYLPEG